MSDARPYEKLVFVCVHGKSCPRQGAMEVCSALREKVFKAGQKDRIRVVKSGCLAQCGHGPVVAIEPSGEWFSSLNIQDGSLLGDLLTADSDLPGDALPKNRYRPAQMGKNILPEENWRIQPDSGPST
ncbi:MAG: hypothetical protein CBC13_03960 [Planctomycetia bacterium TMED53]|nr:MAG: hypothetical protein CBC13_03960 [Planctomycetia bacterium TMED53]